MGLDTYAYHTTENELLADELFAHIPPLCGGIMSGGEGSSIRGKVYASFLSETVGLNLYQEWIDPTVVKAAAARLQDWLATATPDQIKFAWTAHGLREREIRTLAEWLSVVGENNGRLHGWW